MAAAACVCALNVCMCTCVFVNAAAGAKRREDECKKRETEEKKRYDEVVAHAVSDNDDFDSEDMRIAMALSISHVRNEEQGAWAGAQWSCTVCTVSIGVVLFS